MWLSSGPQNTREKRMPNIKSARKRVRLSAKWAARNRSARSRIRTSMKKVLQSESAEEAQPHLLQAIRLLDRAARTRLYHPNAAARYKSRLTRHVNGLG